MNQITIKNLIVKALQMDSKIRYWENPRINELSGVIYVRGDDGELKETRAVDQRIKELKETKVKCVEKLNNIGFDYDKLAQMIKDVADD